MHGARGAITNDDSAECSGASFHPSLSVVVLLRGLLMGLLLLLLLSSS